MQANQPNRISHAPIPQGRSEGRSCFYFQRAKPRGRPPKQLY